MKIVAKTKAILIANTAETMAEVLVAFIVLTLVMALFAQGLRYATSAETYAKDNTVKYDESLLKLQKTLAVGGEGAENIGEAQSRTLDADTDTFEDSDKNSLKLTQYGVKQNGDTAWNFYWVFDAR
jgi:hypothetical protein